MLAGNAAVIFVGSPTNASLFQLDQYWHNVRKQYDYA